jgi:hypothetical protein
MKPVKAKTLDILRLAVFAVTTITVLMLSLTIPAQRARAGFTPTPAPPTDTPGPPTDTPLPPTATPVPPTRAPSPTRRPKSKQPSSDPGPVEPTPTPAPPMPETGRAGWLVMALLLWAASLFFVLPMMGPLRKRGQGHTALPPKRKREKHDRTDENIQ